MKFPRVVLPALLAFGLVGAVQSLYAAAGSLDSTFGSNGIVSADFNSQFLPGDMIEQPDGKILVSNAYFPFQVVRFEPSGILDNSFGTGGVTNPFAPNNNPSSAGALALQPNGQIIVVAGGGSVVRLNSDGSLDTSFGNRGLTIPPSVPTGWGFSAGPALVQPDGKILLGATASNIGYRTSVFQTLLARYNADGTPDTTFGKGGSIQVAASQGVTTMALLANGDIVTVNFAAIAQFSSTGTARSNVTGGSIAVIAGSSFGAETIEHGGDYVLAEVQNAASGRCHDYNTTVIRYTLTGTVDSTFSRPLFNFAGVVGCGVSDAVSGIAVQADGKIVLAGAHSVPSSNTVDNALIRLNTDGSLDSTFGRAGVVLNQLPANARGYSKVLIQSDGKIVVAGTTAGTTSPAFNAVSNLTLSRYLPQ
ncbi:MAG: hypothetical protein JO159_12125 [Acidobacteria bacterium]|nr:hypothetical protein [Acidobacteriota bacterium]MBV9625108.1 hypothetical protein [Acidobacteriota bacterium]